MCCKLPCLLKVVMFALGYGRTGEDQSSSGAMVRLSGYSVELYPNGEIEIIYWPAAGEKLFEELLIDAVSKPTEHPLIFRAQEQLSCQRSWRNWTHWKQLSTSRTVRMH